MEQNNAKLKEKSSKDDATISKLSQNVENLTFKAVNDKKRIKRLEEQLQRLKPYLNYFKYIQSIKSDNGNLPPMKLTDKQKEFYKAKGVDVSNVNLTPEQNQRIGNVVKYFQNKDKRQFNEDDKKVSGGQVQTLEENEFVINENLSKANAFKLVKEVWSTNFKNSVI